MKRIFLILLTLLCPFIYGQSIFSNEITGSNPGQISPYITGQITDLNITVTGISRGSGIQGRNANNRYNAINWDTPTLDSNDYFEFTISPNAGYEINFISFEYTGQSSPSGPVNVAFRSSLDSY